MSFIIKQNGRNSNRDKSLVKSFKSPAFMASGFSNTFFLLSNLNEICDRLTCY